MLGFPVGFGKAVYTCFKINKYLMHSTKDESHPIPIYFKGFCSTNTYNRMHHDHIVSTLLGMREGEDQIFIRLNLWQEKNGEKV